MGTSEHISELRFQVDGMTCTSCARRVERSLERVEGVGAHVNFATGKAHVEHAGPVDVQQLIGAIERAGYSAHVDEPARDALAADEPGAQHSHDSQGLRARLLVSAPLTLAVLVMTMIMSLRPPEWELIALALSAPVALWCAWPFHRMALRSARHGAANMDTLVSLGILAAWGWSLASSTVVSDGHSYVEVAAVTTTLVLTGRVLEAGARRRAGDALRGLLDLTVRRANVLDADGSERAVDARELRVGDLFVVRPGEGIATDGVVTEGASAIDRSVVTGESQPESVGAGDEVLGATRSTDGRIVVRATRVGSDTALAQIAELVERAQTTRATVQRLADRVSAVFVPVVMALSALTLGAWLLSGASTGTAVGAAVAVLIVACPCALGLATPAALLVGSGRGAQLGIVIRSPEVLERARRVDTIVLDKTGTVTTGSFALERIVVGAGVDETDALRIAGELEGASEHPVARAIAAAARAASTTPLPAPTDFTNHPGRGVSGIADGRSAVVGSASLLASLDCQIDDELAASHADAAADGATAVFVGWDGAAHAVISVRDELKPDSAAAVAALRDLDVRVILATGDADAAGRAAARAIGVTDVHTAQLPADKERLIGELQAAGARVAMVGDGVNDAPALARADLGIAIGAGADVAIDASDLTLVSGSLWAAVDAVRLSRATLRTIHRNLFWAFAYNAAAIPLAMSGLLQPAIAGGAMAASSLFVLGGSLLLRRFEAHER